MPAFKSPPIGGWDGATVGGLPSLRSFQTHEPSADRVHRSPHRRGQMAPDETNSPGGPDEPISSEDLVRQAREALSSGGSVPAHPVDADSGADLDSEAMVDAAEDSFDEEPDATEPLPDDDPMPDDDPFLVAAPPQPPTAAAEADPFGDTPQPATTRRPATVTDRMTTPPPAPPAPPSSMSRIWQSRGILVGLVILGIIGFRFFDSSTGVDNLSVGDCFDEPAALEFNAVDVVDCAEPHDYEVLATVDLSGDTYPGDFEVTIQAFERCLEPFEAYVGIAFDASEVYIAPFVPAEESWDD
ncbi:MAG: hypothetical protein HKN01_06510, partial [Acidimicrobiia bacterium]|nr:hypothetical protein [Acidimicrobiia bacterium]